VLDGEGQPCVISQELSSEPNGDEIANCCEQALAQACAFVLPFSISISDIEILTNNARLPATPV